MDDTPPVSPTVIINAQERTGSRGGASTTSFGFQRIQKYDANGQFLFPSSLHPSQPASPGPTPALPGTSLVISKDDIAGIQEGILRMRLAQEEQHSLLQDLLQQGQRDLKATQQLVQGMHSKNPVAVTHSEIEALLERYLQSMERKLQTLASAPVVRERENQIYDNSQGDALDRRGAEQIAAQFVEVDDYKSPREPETEAVEEPQDLRTQYSMQVVEENESLPKDHSSGNPLKDASKHSLDFIEMHKIDRELISASLGEKSLIHSKMADKLVLRMEAMNEWWNQLKMPEHDNCVYWLVVHSSFFKPLCMLAIALNSVLVAVVSSWQLEHIGQDEPRIYYILQLVFGAFFLVELILRLAAFGFAFFYNDDMLWNIFDFSLVAISVVDFCFEIIVGAEGTSNASFARMLRLFKLARIFRSLRTFQFFKALQHMMTSMRQALHSLVWGLIFLVFILYFFSLVYIQALIDYLSYDVSETWIDAEVRKFVRSEFHSLVDVVIKLYVAMTGGADWGIYFEIADEVGSFYGIAFLLFSFFFIFGLFNILTAILVEKATIEGQPDRSDQILSRHRSLEENRQELTKLCKSMDVDKSGRISAEEFDKWISNPIMHHYFASFGLDVSDVKLFFAAVDARHTEHIGHAKGEVTIARFVEGCLHMKGSATAIDMQKQLYETDILIRNVQRLETLFREGQSRIEKRMTNAHFAI